MKMLKGIDISHYQAGIDIKKLDIDVMICKATEGIGFVDKYCSSYINDAIERNYLFGFYHFARTNDPKKEASFFYKNVKNWVGKGIPVLDYEVWGKNKNDVDWCERFIKKFHELSGIWCMIYISASHCKDFRSSWIPTKCKLWVAGYPKNYTYWTNKVLPYNIAPWKSAAVWQFTSSLKLKGFSGKLDGDYIYLTRRQWDNISGNTVREAAAKATPDYEKLAYEVLNGQWGNGTKRKKRLDLAYGVGTYRKVQDIVNKKLKFVPNYELLAREVIAGKWGNGVTRKKNLERAYGAGTYRKVQDIVNRMMP